MAIRMNCAAVQILTIFKSPINLSELLPKIVSPKQQQKCRQITIPKHVVKHYRAKQKRSRSSFFFKFSNFHFFKYLPCNLFERVLINASGQAVSSRIQWMCVENTKRHFRRTALNFVMCALSQALKKQMAFRNSLTRRASISWSTKLITAADVLRD